MAARTHTYILYLSSGAQARRMLTYSMVPFCVLIMLPEKKRNPERGYGFIDEGRTSIEENPEAHTVEQGDAQQLSHELDGVRVSSLGAHT